MRGSLLFLTLFSLVSLEGGMSLPTEVERGLSVSLWRVFPDTAVFDWYITLADKHKMVSCNLTYGPQADKNKTRLVTNFLPKHRSFSLLNLEQNTSYSFLMSCSDRQDTLWSSEKINFDTGVVISSVDPKLGAIFSPRRQEIESANRDIRSKYIMGQYKARDPVSPHTLMAVSCTIVGLIITGTTLGIVARRYSRADRIKIPKEVETQMLDGQLQTAEVADCSLSLGMGSMGTGSVSSAASYIDISGYVDSAPYSFTEGEAEQPTTVQTSDLF